MVFWNRKEEERYDCTKEEKYIAYHAILNYKYTEWFKQNPTEEDIKRKLFTLNTKLEQELRFNSFISLSISISLMTLMLDDRFNDFLWSLCTNYFTLGLFMFFKVVIICGAVISAIKSWGEEYKKQNKELSMLKLEKQVLEEFIEEKRKNTNTYKVKARKVKRS